MVALYATTDDVLKRDWFRGKDVTETSRPSLQDVRDWLSEAEAEVNGALAGIGLSVPFTPGSNQALQLRRHIVNYAEGRLRMEFAAVGGDGTNADGKDLVAAFDAFIQRIYDNAERIARALTTDSSNRGASSYTLDNDDGLSIAAGDFDPVFRVKNGDFGEDNF